MSAVTVPYSPDGEESRQSEKAGENSEIQGASARRAADRAGAGGTAQSRDQSRRSRSRIHNGHTLRKRKYPPPQPSPTRREGEEFWLAAAAGQFERPPLRRRGCG